MKKKIVSIMLAAMLSASLFAGCGTKSDEERDRYNASNTFSASDYEGTSKLEEDDYGYECLESYEYEENADYGTSYSASAKEGQTGSGQTSSPSKADTNVREDKMVYEAYLEIETLDFDSTYNKLIELVEENGGRIESEQFDSSYSSYTNNNRARDGYHTTKVDYLVIRIPAKNYKAFIESDKTLGNIVGKTQSLDNISQQYYSTETKVELLEGQLEYYKHQLEIVEENMMDYTDYDYVIGTMIELEDRIIAVQNEINGYKNNIVTMDNQVEYSTITLTLTEVKEYTDITPVKEEDPDTFGNRVKNVAKNALHGFCSFLETILFGIMYALPYIIVVAVLTIITVVIVKCKNKKNKKKKGIATNAVCEEVKADENVPADETAKTDAESTDK